MIIRVRTSVRTPSVPLHQKKERREGAHTPPPTTMRIIKIRHQTEAVCPYQSNIKV